MPARPFVRSAGTFVLGTFIIFSACERSAEGADSGPRLLELDSSSIDLPDSVRLVIVGLDRALTSDMDPAEVEVVVGDIVRFQARDGAAHAIGFDGTGLTPEARRFLEVTGQMRSPPLVSADRAWVVSFGNAPPGDYPYTCVTHGAAGRIVVQPR